MAMIQAQGLVPPAHRLHVARLRERMALARYHYNVALVAVVADEERRGQVLRRRRRWWIRPWLMRRPLYGQYETLMVELERESPADFKAFLRLDPAMYNEVLLRVGPRIAKSRW